MEWLYKLGGIAIIMASVLVILFAFGTTGLDHGDPNVPPPRTAILRQVTDEQRGPLLLGGALLGLAGLWLAFSKPDPPA